MSKELVSVIIPVFNTEPIYLEKCLDSIIGQSYERIEVIIVNDGSTSAGTLALLEKISKEKKIKIINSKNSGVSEARNKGLNLARGEFIMFVDSDDYVAADYIEKMVSGFSNYSAIFSGKQKVLDGKVCNPDYGCEEKIIKLPLDSDSFVSHSYAFTSQGAIFRAKAVANTRFRSHFAHGEDTLFVAEALNHKRFIYTGDGGYFYVNRIGSVSNRYDIPSIRKYIKNHANMLDNLASILDVKPEVVSASKIEKILNASRKLIVAGVTFKVYKNEIKYYLGIMSSGHLTLRSLAGYSFMYKTRLKLLSDRHLFLSYILSWIRERITR